MHKPFGVVNQYHPYIKCPISLHILSPLSFLTLNKSISLSVLQNFSKIPHDNHSFPFLKPKFYHVKFSLFLSIYNLSIFTNSFGSQFFHSDFTNLLNTKKKKIAFFFLMTGKLFKVRALWTDPCQVNPRCTTPFARTVHQIILELNSS